MARTLVPLIPLTSRPAPRAGAALLALVMVAAAAVLRVDTPINHDVAWNLVAAARMLGGGSYADDFFELHMPVGIALYLPVRLLATGCHLPLAIALYLWVVALSAQSIYLSARVFKLPVRAGADNRYALGWLVWQLIGFLLLPGYHFAQKEHLLVILVLPFLLLLGSDGAAQRRGLRIHVTLLAALGCFLKPHYALLPLLLLTVRAAQDRNWQALRSLEALIIIGSGLVNALFVIGCYPDWFTVAQWAADLYGGYRRGTFAEVIDGVPLWVCVGSASGSVLLAVSDRGFRAYAVFLLATAAYGLCTYLLQYKGWEYQFLPVSLTLFLLSGLAFLQMVAILPQPRPWRRTLLALTVVMAAVGLAQVLRTTRQLPRWSLLQQSSIGEALSVAARGEHVYVFSTTIVPIFPTVVQLGLDWGSRLPSLWPLAGLRALDHHDHGAGSARYARYAQQLRSMVADDFARYAPTVVVLDRRNGQFGLPAGFNILDYFLTDQRFAALWQRYALIGSSPAFSVYARAHPATAVPSAASGPAPP